MQVASSILHVSFLQRSVALDTRRRLSKVSDVSELTKSMYSWCNHISNYYCQHDRLLPHSCFVMDSASPNLLLPYSHQATSHIERLLRCWYPSITLHAMAYPVKLKASLYYTVTWYKELNSRFQDRRMGTTVELMLWQTFRRLWRLQIKLYFIIDSNFSIPLMHCWTISWNQQNSTISAHSSERSCWRSALWGVYTHNRYGWSYLHYIVFYRNCKVRTSRQTQSELKVMGLCCY